MNILKHVPYVYAGDFRITYDKPRCLTNNHCQIICRLLLSIPLPPPPQQRKFNRTISSILQNSINNYIIIVFDVFARWNFFYQQQLVFIISKCFDHDCFMLLQSYIHIDVNFIFLTTFHPKNMRRKQGYFGTIISFRESHDSSHQLKKGSLTR